MENKNQENKKSIPELSIDSKTLYDRLIKSEIGEIITYDELSDTIGRNVRPNNEAYGNLVTAREMAKRDDEMIFAAVTKIGLKRLNDVEIVSTAENAFTRIRRAARKGSKTLVCVQDFDALPNDTKIKHNTALSILGAINHFTTPKKRKEVESRVETAGNQLPIMKTLEAFQSHHDPI